MEQAHGRAPTPLADLSDEELVRVTRGRTSWWAARELLFLRHYTWLKTFIAREGGKRGLSAADVEDAQQDAGMALLRAIADYQPGPAGAPSACTLRTFLGRVVFDQLRVSVRTHVRFERRHHRSAPAADVLEGMSGRPGSLRSAADPAIAAAEREALARLQAILRDRDPVDRALHEGAVDGKSLKVVAPQVGLSYDKAKRRKRRLDADLAAEMVPYLDGPIAGERASRRHPEPSRGATAGLPAADHASPAAAPRRSTPRTGSLSARGTPPEALAKGHASQPQSPSTSERTIMARRYLLGPVSATLTAANFAGPRARGDCLTFGPPGTADITAEPGDGWDSIRARLPEGWTPDFVVLNLRSISAVAASWPVPVPLVGLAPDWRLRWHAYRRPVGCDLLLTDPAGAEAFAREGIAHARAVDLGGCTQAWLEGPGPEGPRDIDVLCAGALDRVVQREPLRWLGRLARLADRFRVVIHPECTGPTYRALLARARIVFHHGTGWTSDRHQMEAAAAGALVFRSAEGAGSTAALRDGQECVCTTEDDLEALLEHYLEREDERCKLADAGRAQAREYTFECQWHEALALIDRDWTALAARAAQRAVPAGRDQLLARTWEALAAKGPGDPALVADLADALVREPHAADLHHALGLAEALSARGSGPTTAAVAQRAVRFFRRAVEREPAHLVAGLNLVEALVGSGQTQAALEEGKRLSAALDGADRSGGDGLDAGHFPPELDTFRVEWERAAWAHAGRPHAESQAKRGVLRWRLHELLAVLTGDLAHCYEAAAARPDLAAARAALGAALAQAGRPAQAVAHLQFALAANPFDHASARTLFQVLGHSGDGLGQRRLADERRLLAEAAPGLVPVEEWVAKVPPAADELASIVVVCGGQASVTRRCLDSVLRHTRAPYELVLVGSGAEDTSAQALEEFRSRPGRPSRVVVLRADSDRGDAAGYNRAIAAARGRYLALLDGTVVTAGWLEGLIGAALHDWPRAGVVGAGSNGSAGAQHVPAGYTDLSGLDAFAARKRLEHGGQRLRSERLSGGCLLLRRDVLRRVGGFDERYHLGALATDDLCLRAREAGFELLAVPGVYVHQATGTVSGRAGSDGRRWQQDVEHFEGKWGIERAVAYRRAASTDGGNGPALAPQQSADAGSTMPPPVTTFAAALAHVAEEAQRADPDRKVRVSLCLIVKNEEANLPGCLLSVADLVDEIVVVDTGSTDATRQAAAQFGAMVVDFPWVDDFAAARNAGLRHATGDWVFWMDADDRLDEDNRAKLKALFTHLGHENAAYVMKCRSVADAQTKTATDVDHVRLFRNHPQVRWQYRVHEQILPAVRQRRGEVRTADVVIQHVGYVDPALRAAKSQRDLRLLLLDQAEHPDDPFILFNLGWAYQALGRPAEALPLLRRSLERSAPSDSIVRKLFPLLMDCHRRLGQGALALACCQEGRHYYPDDAQLLFQEGVLRKAQGDAAGAETCWQRLIGGAERPHFASVAVGLRGYLARHELATLYREQGRLAEAEAQWRAAVAEVPAFAAGWVGLGECCLVQGKSAELDEIVGRLEGWPESVLEAKVLWARGQMAQKEFGTARAVLDEVIGQAPRAVWPRVVLSHCLLQGQEWAAAEAALTQVLALEPGNAEAQRNLAVLRRQLGRSEAGDAAAAPAA